MASRCRLSGFGGLMLMGVVFLAMAGIMVVRAWTEKHPVGRSIFYFMALLPMLAGFGMWWMCISAMAAEWWQGFYRYRFN